LQRVWDNDEDAVYDHWPDDSEAHDTTS
jgi:hypothetical protein